MKDLQELKMIKLGFDYAITQLIDDRIAHATLSTSELDLILDIALKSSITAQMIYHIERSKPHELLLLKLKAQHLLTRH